MRRLTEIERIRSTNEGVALERFTRAIDELDDPRRAQGRRYSLVSVVAIALMAMVCGSDDAEAIDAWGKANKEWLQEILDLPHGTPSQDVILWVFAAFDPEKFRQVFDAWVVLIREKVGTYGKHIAIDGKTSRRTFDKSRERGALHTVSAWLVDEQLVLGQCKTLDKSNEITAIPELLKTIDLRGATIAIDAMGCQRDIAADIVHHGGNYLLAVKGNQPSLHKNIITAFAQIDNPTVSSVDIQFCPLTESFVHDDKGHGRTERRTTEMCSDLAWITDVQKWTGLAYFARITRERENNRTGKRTTEVAYYIGSHTTIDAQNVNRIARNH